MSPVKTGQDMDFSGHFEDALGRVLGHVPGLVLNSSLGTRVLRGLVQLSVRVAWQELSSFLQDREHKCVRLMDIIAEFSYSC